MEDMNKFLEKILEDNGVTGLDDDVKANMVAEMRDYLINQINEAVISKLPDDKIDEFQQKIMYENPSEEELGQFFKNSGVDVAQVTLNTLLRFRSYYKGNNQ